MGELFWILTYGCCSCKVAHPILELQTLSPPRSCCCGPAPALSHWTTIWPTEWGARLPAFHLLSQQTCQKTNLAKSRHLSEYFRNSHVCFCTVLVFGMLVRGEKALDVKLLRCLFSRGVTYGSSRELRTIRICKINEKNKKQSIKENSHHCE